MSTRKNQERKSKPRQKRNPPKPSSGEQLKTAKAIENQQKESYKYAKARVGGKTIKVKPKPLKNNVPASVAMSFGSKDVQGRKVGSNVLNIKGDMEIESLQVAIYTYLSSLYYANAPGVYKDDTSSQSNQAWVELAQGAAWLGQGIFQISQGATAQVTRLPRIFDVLTQMLCEKTVRLGSGVVKYSPEWSGLFELPQTYITPNGAVWTCCAPDDGMTIQYTTAPAFPQEESYTRLLKMGEIQKAFGGQIVEYGHQKGLYTVDPSCFARVYNYFGTGGINEIGCYNEVELEAPFQYPQFARFVKYDKQDKVISRIFHPTTGGISTAIGQTLVQDSSYSLLRNPIPAIYKFIDFYSLYTALCAYMVNLFEQAFIPNEVSGYTPDTFPFTAEYFCAMLRQAVLTQFSCQAHGQFVSPQAGVPSQQASIFEPFTVDSVTVPSQSFSNLLLPQFIVENLNMLKPCSSNVQRTPNSEKYGSVPKRLRHNFYPVWGVYSGDTIPYFQFTYQGVTKPLFQPSGSPDWRLWDGLSLGQQNVKYNFNSSSFNYVLTQWNDIMTRIKNRSTRICPISGDAGPGVSLLMYTRVLETIITPTTDVSGPVPIKPYSSPLYDNVINKPRQPAIKDKTLAKTSSQKRVDAVPPASYFDLYTRNILAHTQMSMDYYGAIRYFILPEIRLDDTGVDPLTIASYSVYTGEVCNVSNSMGSTPADNEVARLSLIGQMMTAGMFAASPDNDALTSAVAELADHANGSDFLKTLLGGMASLIPGVGGVISQVVQNL